MEDKRKHGGDLMLTRRQIQALAQKNRVPLYTQERDYIQAVFLGLLYTKTEDFIFKGGTCLRMLYRSGRFSEDLDFNSNLEREEAIGVLEGCTGEMELFGIRGELKDIRRSATGFGTSLSFAGPLYDGRDTTKGRVRIDVSLRSEEIKSEMKLFKSEYDDVRPFILLAATPEHIFAEKVRALMLRGKARDLYDLWFLIEMGTTADLGLINRKLTLYDRSFDKSEFEKSVKAIGIEWNRDLRALLAAPPPYEMAKERVLLHFKKL
jgi:hypothetical protein